MLEILLLYDESVPLWGTVCMHYKCHTVGKPNINGFIDIQCLLFANYISSYLTLYLVNVTKETKTNIDSVEAVITVLECNSSNYRSLWSAVHILVFMNCFIARVHYQYIHYV